MEMKGKQDPNRMDDRRKTDKRKENVSVPIDRRKGSRRYREDRRSRQ